MATGEEDEEDKEEREDDEDEQVEGRRFTARRRCRARVANQDGAHPTILSRLARPTTTKLVPKGKKRVDATLVLSFLRRVGVDQVHLHILRIALSESSIAFSSPEVSVRSPGLSGEC